ncbi:DUF993 family protein [Mycobacterium yunnanensis]|uniref:DUF993 family protein n=1 Tax=Mycobacterium yunnanensis TaxID=368477 RepID=A0A9X3BV65_9MYCO|nr:dihydrodipicolinate synthase family protein [Mycobacterium yunnanensis]MCV7423484.1 DUF993 family protein [Mycobacterium yunnanensis]
MSVILPTADGELSEVRISPRPQLQVSATPPTSRMVFAASHVVADPLRTSTATGRIDWDATLALRQDIWDVGLGVAESMDTAQRGMGLSAPEAMELAKRTLAADPRGGAGTVVGVTTDALPTGPRSLSEITEAYVQQLDFVTDHGGTAVLMASRHLARSAGEPDDYHQVYGDLLTHSNKPVILHWLGEVFDPALARYWGAGDPGIALDTVVDLITTHRSKVAGIKVSLLDPVFELELRRRLPPGVAVFTGDDFNYTEMIAGDGHGHSHALLGAFAALAPWASAAFSRLDAGDVSGFRAILEPTQPLSRAVFVAPTQYYKVGIAWLAYLVGGQHHPRMLGGFETGRDLLHLAELVHLANAMEYFPDPDFTETRLRTFFAAHGIG